MSNFMRICPVGAELFHAGRHVTKPILAYHNFANEPEKTTKKKSNNRGEHSLSTDTLSSLWHAE